MPEKSRLQKILASSGVASRRKAEELIAALGCGRAVQNTDGEYVYDGDFLILIGSDWH